MVTTLPTVVISQSSGADIIAWLALGVSMLVAGFTVFWSFRAERRGYIDAYWFREVTAPSCIQPSIDLRRNWRPRIEALANQTLDVEAFRRITGELQTAVDKGIDDAWIARLFDGDLHPFIQRHLEAVMDEVTEALQKFVHTAQPVTLSAAARLSADMSQHVLDILTKSAQANDTGLKIRTG